MRQPISTADQFDFIVVGAGTAGCVLAARLSEDAALRVGLIEAGGPANDPDIADPARWPGLAGRPIDWGFTSVAQEGTGGRTHAWPRGKLVGGSSCLNAMAHVRGHPDDFDNWRPRITRLVRSFAGGIGRVCLCRPRLASVFGV